MISCAASIGSLFPWLSETVAISASTKRLSRKRGCLPSPFPLDFAGFLFWFVLETGIRSSRLDQWSTCPDGSTGLPRFIPSFGGQAAQQPESLIDRKDQRVTLFRAPLQPPRLESHGRRPRSCLRHPSRRRARARGRESAQARLGPAGSSPRRSRARSRSGRNRVHRRPAERPCG